MKKWVTLVRNHNYLKSRTTFKNISELSFDLDLNFPFLEEIGWACVYNETMTTPFTEENIRSLREQSQNLSMVLMAIVYDKHSIAYAVDTGEHMFA